MKKYSFRNKSLVLLLAVLIICGVCSFESRITDTPKVALEKNSEKTAKTEEDAELETEMISEGQSAEPETGNGTVQGTTGEFSFADISRLDFMFCSGAGAWSTMLSINADGSFSGIYRDSDAGVFGEGYSGTMSLCEFTGRFTQPVKVNEYTYSMQIAEISYANEADTEEIIDDILYRYTTPYGLDGAENILIYLPGAPLDELSEEFKGWTGCLWEDPGSELTFYALNNEVMQEGFSSYDVVDALQEQVAHCEGYSVTIEQSLEQDALSQIEYTEKTEELYLLWDDVLNRAWEILKRIKNDEEMDMLLIEQREWITWKEEQIALAGENYKGGSLQAAIENLRAAELTKERLYELLTMIE